MIYNRYEVILMKDKSCAYCMKDENPSLYEKFGYFCISLPVSNVYIFREQSKIGRCIVAYKDHISEMCDLSVEERQAFIEDVNKVAVAIHKAFKPNKINYGAYGDTGHHLHFHLCPKYEGGDEWGGIFQMNTGKVMYNDEQLEELAKKLRPYLQ